MTLPQLARLYVRERVATGDYAPTTAPCVRSTLLQFCDHVGDIHPGRLHTRHVEAWMASTRYAKSTGRNRFSRVKLFCQWLVRRGHLKVDPTLGLKPPRQPRPVPRSVDRHAIGGLVDSLPDARARFVVVWMVQLGLRCVEVTRLEVGDVDQHERTVRIRGKGGWPRLLPIPDEAWSAFVGYLVENPAAAGALLRNTREPWKGITANYLSRLVARWMRDAGVAGTGHGLRHSMAAHLLRDQGADVRDVQLVLGHQSLTSTSVYLPFSDVKRLRDVMEGRWYGSSPPAA